MILSAKEAARKLLEAAEGKHGQSPIIVQTDHLRIVLNELARVQSYMAAPLPHCKHCNDNGYIRDEYDECRHCDASAERAKLANWLRQYHSARNDDRDWAAYKFATTVRDELAEKLTAHIIQLRDTERELHNRIAVLNETVQRMTAQTYDHLETIDRLQEELANARGGATSVR